MIPLFYMTVAAGMVCIILPIIIGSLLLANVKYLIVKTRGPRNLHFIGWTSIFVGILSIVLSTVYSYSQIAVAFLISLRHWATLFALMSIFLHQVVLGAIWVPGQPEKHILCIPITVKKHGRIDQVATKVTLSFIGLYLPVFMVDLMSLIYVNVPQLVLSDQVVRLFTFGVIILLLCYYVWLNRVLNRYYSHRVTIAIIGVGTFILYVSRIVINDFDQNLDIVTKYLLDAFIDCCWTSLWWIAYTAQPAVAIALALFGYPQQRDSYQSKPTISTSDELPSVNRSGEPAGQVASPVLSSPVISSPDIMDSATERFSQYIQYFKENIPVNSQTPAVEMFPYV